MIGERLREERKRMRLTQPQLGEIVGASKRTVIEWEQEKTSPSGVQLSALFEVGMDVTYVLTGKRVCEVQETARSNALPRDVDSATAAATNVVVSLRRDNESGLTQQEVLDLVLDALHAAKRTLPAVRIHAVVDAIMAWQRAGAAVTEASVSDQLRLVK